MFALVLKNSILMLLIIFIIHFMILNYAKEFTPSSINSTMTSFTNSVMSLKPTQVNTIPNTNATHTTTASSNQDANSSKESADNTHKATSQESDFIDLYNFVFQENDTSQLDNSQLDSYFPNDSYLKPKHVDVPCSNQPDKGSSKQFCLNEVDEFFKHNSKTKISSQHDSNSTSVGNHPIIFEYKEAKNDLVGFETYESSFMSF